MAARSVVPALIAGALAAALLVMACIDALGAIYEVRTTARQAAGTADVLDRAQLVQRSVTRFSLASDEAAAAALEQARRDMGALRTAERHDRDDRPRAHAARFDAVEQALADVDGPREERAARALVALQRVAMDETRDLERQRTHVDRLTSRTLIVDGGGGLVGLLLGAAAVALARGARREGRAERPAADTTIAPARSPAAGSSGAAAAVAWGRPPSAAPPWDDDSQAELTAALERARVKIAAENSRTAAQRDELAAIVDSSFDAFLAFDAEGSIIHWNARAEELFGWTREEALGAPPFDAALCAATPDETPLAVADLWALAGTRGARDEPVELLARRRDGERIPVEVALSTTAAPDGDEPRLQAFVRDISHRRRHEVRVRVEHAVTKAIAEAGDEAEAARRVLDGLAAIFRWAVGAVWVAADDEDGVRLLECWTDGARELDAWEQACRALPPGHGAGMPGRAFAGRRAAWSVEAATDEGDPRAAAAERAGLHAALCLPLVVHDEVVAVLEVADREARDPDVELLASVRGVEQIFANYLARRRAEAEADQAKADFLALVSHELRTPLTSIHGYAQMLAMRLPDDAERERRCTDVIMRNSDRLQRLVRDLLFAAQLGRGEMGLEAGVVDVEQLVAGALEAAGPAARRRGVELELERDAQSTAAIAGDAERLGQVLDNVLSNAIKFSDNGGRVVVRVGEEDGDLVIAVRDEGIGVPADEVEQLAQRFFRASTARTHEVQGVGLGLALSKAIVEGHGGRLGFESVEGEGTTVSVRLPLRVAAPVEV